VAADWETRSCENALETGVARPLRVGFSFACLQAGAAADVGSAKRKGPRDSCERRALLRDCAVEAVHET